MSKVKVYAGICGFYTEVSVDSTSKKKAVINIDSECTNIQNMAKNFGEVDIMTELFKKGKSKVLAAGQQYIPHITCPVLIGIFKALEVNSGLALPKDVSITFDE